MKPTLENEIILPRHNIDFFEQKEAVWFGDRWARYYILLPFTILSLLLLIAGAVGCWLLPILAAFTGTPLTEPVHEVSVILAILVTITAPRTLKALIRITKLASDYRRGELLTNPVTLRK